LGTEYLRVSRMRLLGGDTYKWSLSWLEEGFKQRRLLIYWSLLMIINAVKCNIVHSYQVITVVCFSNHLFLGVLLGLLGQFGGLVASLLQDLANLADGILHDLLRIVAVLLRNLL
jgi:hypothetical protein